MRMRRAAVVLAALCAAGVGACAGPAGGGGGEDATEEPTCATAGQACATGPECCQGLDCVDGVCVEPDSAPDGGEGEPEEDDPGDTPAEEDADLPTGEDVDSGVGGDWDGPLPPEEVSAFHRSGQTFVTWPERADLAGEQYRVYRHAEPITAENLSEARILATLPEGSSAYHTERMRDADYPAETNGGYRSLENYIIQPLGEELPDTTGLFVWTAAEAAEAYYAVATLHGGAESLDDPEAATAGPVAETVADPSPIPVWESDSGRGRVYTQFVDYANWNPTYETGDGPTYAYNYFVGLPSEEQCGGSLPEDYAVLLHIEGYGSRYEAGEGAHYYCAAEIWCDDPRQSWYFGYSATHDYSDLESIPETGPIVNFTEQRVLRALYDTLRDSHYRLDSRRVYAYGHSMGASGALALAMRYPGVFAAVYCSEPMTNYQACTDCNPGSASWVEDAEPKWGTVTANLPVENRGVYAAHLARFDGTGVWDWQNHRAQLVERAGDEVAFVALAHGTEDNVISWSSQGQPAYGPFHESGRAFSGAVVDADHTWIGFHGMGPTVGEHWEGLGTPFHDFQVVGDETLPGLAHASGGLPVPPETTGGYNLTLDWSASWNAWDGAPVDTAEEWGISLRTTDGSTQTVDVTPRRVQNFGITAGARYDWENREVNGDALRASGTVTADEHGLVTVPAVEVTPEGTRLRIAAAG